MDLWIISMTIPALVVQVMDTRRGRKTAAAAVAQTATDMVPSTNSSAS